jgi:Predicted transcriptional regulator with C-terminal CBS domains
MAKLKHSYKVSKLKKIRTSKGLTQQQLARISGIPAKSIGNLEQLRRNINHSQVHIVYRLAAALECSITDLLDIEYLQNFKKP